MFTLTQKHPYKNLTYPFKLFWLAASCGATLFTVCIKQNQYKQWEAESSGWASLCPLLLASNGDWQLYERLTAVTIALGGWTQTRETAITAASSSTVREWCGCLPENCNTQPNQHLSSVSHRAVHRRQPINSISASLQHLLQLHPSDIEVNPQQSHYHPCLNVFVETVKYPKNWVKFGK